MKLVIKQRRSTIKRPANQKATVRALGLRKMNHEVVHDDTPQIRGMVAKVGHLVEVREVQADQE
jgi:large subunit ribosomal protein L30